MSISPFPCLCFAGGIHCCPAMPYYCFYYYSESSPQENHCDHTLTELCAAYHVPNVPNDAALSPHLGSGRFFILRLVHWFGVEAMLPSLTL